MDDSTPQVSRDSQSDNEEFLRRFTKHARQIYGHIRALLPNQTDAEDVFQETSVIL